METIHLTLATVVANARKAYENGDLQAQKPGPRRPGGCSYRGPCAIGVSLTKQQASWLDSQSESYISHLVLEDSLVEVDDIEGLQRLQSAHDDWKVGASTEENFVLTLEALEAELTASAGH